MDIYVGDYVYCLIFTNKYSYEKKTIYKVTDEVVYTDKEYINYLSINDYYKSWYRTEKEAIRFSGHKNRELKKERLNNDRKNKTNWEGNE